MFRKPKVHAFSVEQGEEYDKEGFAVASESVEVKTEAEQLTDVKNGVKADADEVVEPVLTQKVADQGEEPKAKAKRAPKAKAKAEAPPEVTPPLVVEAAPARVEDAKASCRDCGKQMSAKTLEYSRTCTTAKKNKEGDEEYANMSHVAKHIVREK